MILLYTVLLLLLGLLKLLVSLRARALERKYTHLAGTVDKLIREADYRPGNGVKPDLCTSAKRTFLLGRLVQDLPGRQRAAGPQSLGQAGKPGCTLSRGGQPV